MFSPSTRAMQSFSRPVEPYAGVQTVTTCGSQNFDGVRRRMAAGPWLGTPDACQSVERSYDAIDRRDVCEMQYRPAADNSSMAYITAVPAETETGSYQTSSYRSVDWSAGYQCVAAGVEDGKDHVSGSQPSVKLGSNQLMDSCQSGDYWFSGVTAKKSKQVRPTHGRRTTQAASRRASTGSLLCTTVSYSPSFPG